MTFLNPPAGSGGLVAKLCLTLVTPWIVDSSIQGISQARILE